MAFVRKIKGSLVTQDSSVYIGEETYLFYDIETGCIRRCDGTPGGAPLGPGCSFGGGGNESWREPAVVRDGTPYASNANFPITGTIDGTLLADGARVLFTNVTAAGESNVWVWNSTTTSWTEDTKAEEDGDALIVQEGSSSDEFWLYNGTTWTLFSGGGGTPSPLTTKGDIYTYDTGDARLPVGTDGQVLVADSSTATGLKWDTAAGGLQQATITIAPTNTSTVISFAPTLNASTKYLITVVDTVTGDVAASEVYGSYKQTGNVVSHNHYSKIGDKIKYKPVVAFSSPNVNLDVTNNDTNPITVSVTRIPVISI